MDFSTFKRILTSFADAPSSIDAAKGKLTCEIRDEVIEVTTRIQDGEVLIKENGDETSATKWLLTRIARMPILADRLLTAFKEPKHFISSRGALINQLDEDKDGDSILHGDATDLTMNMLGQRPAGCSNVIYLTSDAGEGKTTLITHLARLQAEKFKKKETDWLLVPISLGGKPFLRFDDLVVGFLGNHLRFPLFYFEAFIELVKMGALVPAFDGFEEMFVQSPQGEALSAIGTLMGTLDSSGTVLIAARKAYFEYQDMRTTARLFDSIGKSSVVFSRVKLERWEKAEFLSYCQKRGVENGLEIHNRVSERLKNAHPLLSRAVLVKRLLDVASEAGSLSELLQQIGNSPNDYFSVFVHTIIAREANEKWINRVGEPHQPLISVEEHFELLSTIAQEMWSLSTDSLKAEVLDLITELFCDSRKLPVEIAFQIKERTKQHALIVGTSGVRQTFAFDHEEFKDFFLGNALGRICAKADPTQKFELLGLLRKGSLSNQTVEAALFLIRERKTCGSEKVAAFLQDVAGMDGPASYTHENVARLLIKILHRGVFQPTVFSGLAFSMDILRDLVLTNLTFKDCSFGPTSLENTTLKNCSFENCHFDRLDLHATTMIISSSLVNSDVGSVLPVSKDDAVFDPELILGAIRAVGFQVPIVPVQKTLTFHAHEDPDIKLFRRLLRSFQYRTHINEHVILKKLGPGAEMFVKNVFPKLLKAQIFSAEWIARDKQSRYHLAISMERLNELMRRQNTSIDDLIINVSEH